MQQPQSHTSVHICLKVVRRVRSVRQTQPVILYFRALMELLEVSLRTKTCYSQSELKVYPKPATANSLQPLYYYTVISFYSNYHFMKYSFYL